MEKIEWTVEGLAPKIEGFLDRVLDACDLDLNYDILAVEDSVEAIGPEIAVDFEGRDTGLLLNRRGEALLALEHLTLESLGVPHSDRHRLIFDVDEYRILRIHELCLRARKAAERVKSTGERYEFPPMTSRERRIIHITLREDDAITTLSEGVPPARYTVIETAGGNPA